MSQKIIIGVLGAVIVAGGGFWFYQNQSNSAPANSMESKDAESQAKESDEDKGMLGELGAMFTDTFADIMLKGQSAYCTFEGIDPETGEPVKGSIYTSGENFSMEADTMIQGTPLTMQIMQKDRVMYMWSDNEEVMPAMKIDTTMFPEDDSAAPESPLAFLEDPESGVDYSCRAWVPRSSTFEPPEDIEFYDMFGGMMGAFGEMMQEEMGDGNTAQ